MLQISDFWSDKDETFDITVVSSVKCFFYFIEYHKTITKFHDITKEIVLSQL